MPSSSRNRFDVISVGDTMLDLFFKIHEASVACQSKPGSCLLCLEYGEKIPVQKVTKVAGAGNASNAAIGAQRLGMKSMIVSILGTDDVAQDILRRWKQEGVNTSGVVQDKKHDTSMSAVLEFQGDRTILLYNQPRQYSLPRLPTTSWIYYTALGPKHERLEKQLLTYLKQHPGTQLLFNPGPHQIRRGLISLTPVIARSDVFIVNKEEAEHMLATTSSPKVLVQEFLELGAKHVVITDGAQGAWGGNKDSVWSSPIFPGPVVERTGAGDSFAIGVMYALFAHQSLFEALRYGTANAWSVIQHVGPHVGLLDKPHLLKILKKFHKIQPRLAR